MKNTILIFTTLTIFFASCQKHPTFSLVDKEHPIIAIQPLDGFKVYENDSVIVDISHFFNKRVIVLKSIIIPEHFFNSDIRKYSADSIVMLLSTLQKDSIGDIVGLTHMPLFTTRYDKTGPYYSKKLFGFGDEPGNSCVVTDYSLRIPFTTSFNEKLRNVIIHEIGHNLGLSHCKNSKCIMSNNDNLAKLQDYCKKCWGKLNH